MKQFGRTMLTVVGLAVVAVLSSIPAQASGPSRSVTAHGVGGSLQSFIDMSNPDDPVSVNVNLTQTSGTNYFLFYFINDAAGTFTDSSFGSIPASSVNVSGGSVNTGKTVVTLNVNTCDFAEFIANGQGPCGTLDITWTELPASFTGSVVERSNIVTTFPPSQQFPEGEEMVQIGDVVGFTARVTGTAFNFSNTGPAFGQLTQERNVTKTFIIP